MSISLERYQKLILEVAEHLDGNWEFIPDSEDWSTPGGKLFDQETKCMIDFDGVPKRGCDWNAPPEVEKIKISGELPKDAKGQKPHVGLPYGQSMPSICVNGDKRAEIIAKDIERRLLPEYIPLLKIGLERISSSNAYENKVEKLKAELIRITRCPDEGVKGREISFYRCPHPIFNEKLSNAHISSDEIKLELSLEPELAFEVLHFLMNR